MVTAKLTVCVAAMLPLLLLAPAMVQAGDHQLATVVAKNSSVVLGSPFASANLNPFVQAYNPQRAETAQLAAAGTVYFRLQGEVASHFTTRSVAGRDEPESISIDGETHQINIKLKYAVSDDLEWAVSIPYSSHESGRLDSAIDSWHKFWGLPDGARPSVPADQLRMSYRRDEFNNVQLTESVDGIGDLRLALAYQLARGDSRYWSLRASLKLPTGDSNKLTGTESRDLALSLALSEGILFGSDRWQLHASAGLTRLGDGDLLNQRRRDWVGFASSTLSWRMRPNIALKLQVDAHSAYYHSELKELGEPSAQLVLGATLTLAEQWAFDVALSEDIIVDTAPDVVFFLGLNRVF